MWAWQLGGTDEPVLVQAGVAPGIDFKVIVDDTRPLIFACPPDLTTSVVITTSKQKKCCVALLQMPVVCKMHRNNIVRMGTTPMR